jgi:large subunit ribosomal protein L29
LTVEEIPMETKELRAKDAPALNEELRQLLRAQLSARLQRATQQLQDHSQLRKLRRDIARVHTVIAEKASKR